MDNTADNDNTNATSTLSSNTVETVEKPKKQKRKFEWTPKQKEAFEKCVAARKNQLQAPIIQPKQKVRKTYSTSSSDSSVSSSSSEEKYIKPKRKGLKKQLYKLKKDLIYNMHKTLRPKKSYLHENDNDTEDYYYPSVVPNHQPAQEYTESYNQPPPEQKQQPIENTQKYCFL